MELGISQEKLDSKILSREADALESLREATTNPTAWLLACNDFESLVHLYSWANSETTRVHSMFHSWIHAYRETLSDRDRSGASDRSVVSSCRTLAVLSAAWVINATELTTELARAIWDPPDAKYVLAQSESCRPDQQQFAYSVREYVTGSKDKALELCRAVKPLDTEVAAWTTIFNCILNDTGARIPGALQVMLTAHEREARRKKYPFTVEYGVCLVALGLVAVALRKGLVRLDQLPESQFLPFQWIRL